MKKLNRVKSHEDFNKVIKKGILYKNSYYVMYILNNNLNIYRFGISASTKLGNAVERNYLKRKMRHIVDNNKKYYQNGMDYIIIIRKPFIESKFDICESKFIDLINRVDIKEK